MGVSLCVCKTLSIEMYIDTYSLRGRIAGYGNVSTGVCKGCGW